MDDAIWKLDAHRIADFVRGGELSAKEALETFNVQEMARAIERRHENNRRLAELFDDVDILLTPTTATTAFRAEGPAPREINGQPANGMDFVTFTFPFNISGHPGFTVPCGFDTDGLPVGLQIVTRRHHDHVLFQLAAAFESASPWPKIATNYA